MISKTSFFNKGIYKSNLKRNLWGSVLYFITLFVITGLSMLLHIQQNGEYINTYEQRSILLRSEYLLIPLLISIVAPTIVGLLVFRFIHSKKAAVFTHSLPMTRTANYVSTVLSGLTLMIVPILLNTLVLAVFSLCGFSEYFSLKDCLVWMLYNFYGVFIMFSCVCLASTITGNGFAMIVLNILVHTILIIVTAGMNIVARAYLYGFPNVGNLTETFVENCFPVHLVNTMVQFESGMGTYVSVATFLIAAVVLYVLSALLYKKRHMETVGDVAGFACLKAAFKYLVTFVATLAVFAIMYVGIEETNVIFWVIVTLISAIVYFAIEMLMKKTLRIFSGIKGFIAFAAAFAAIICFFNFTTFFGYETRIPDVDDIKGVMVYDYVSEINFVQDKEASEYVVDLHKRLLSERESSKESYVNIAYQLTNGNTLQRKYYTTTDKAESILAETYSIDAFKKIKEPVFKKIDNFIVAEIFNIEEPISIEDNKQIKELVECMRKDIDTLDYEYVYFDGWDFGIQIQYLEGDAEKTNEYEGEFFRYDINMNFKNTINWLKENGYWDKIKSDEGAPLYVVENDNIPFMDFWDIEIDYENAIILEEEACSKFYDFQYTEYHKNSQDSPEYIVYRLSDPENMMFRFVAGISSEQLNKLK